MKSLISWLFTGVILAVFCAAFAVICMGYVWDWAFEEDVKDAWKAA